jgi:single-strand DNA-binding protein
MNKVLLTGRITKDPEIRYTSNGTANLLFTLAVDSTQRDANGSRQAFFISCVAWGQQADFMSRYVKKGNMLAITGRIQTRSYQDQAGQTHYVTEVVVEAVENLTPRDPNQPQQGYQQPAGNFQQPQNNPYQGYNNPSYGQPQQPAYGNQSNDNGTPKSFNVNVDDEDMPF